MSVIGSLAVVTCSASLEELVSGAKVSQNLRVFFDEVEAVMKANPGFLTLADTPETANKMTGYSGLAYELGVAVIKRFDVAVSCKGAVQPLFNCFSKAEKPYAGDFNYLLGYSSRLDHANPEYDRQYWSGLRFKWEQAAEARPELVSNFQEHLIRYRAASLVMEYSENVFGSTDMQRAARMEAHLLHKDLLRLLPLIN